jgi:Leucine-rich repeat (LRR) protein
MFHSLRELYINQCPPSTVDGLYSLRFQLERLEIINSGIFRLCSFIGPPKWEKSFQLDPILLPGDAIEIPNSMQWKQLTCLRLSNCGLDQMDKGMHLFPIVEQLDISFNDIAHVVHLQDCRDLRIANMSFNRIRVLSNLSRVIKNIRKLNLSNNSIESLDGVSALEHLEM